MLNKDSESQRTCRVWPSTTRYVSHCFWLRPRVVNGVKHLYLGAVELMVGVIRPCSVTPTSEYVHFVADASCRVKVSPSGRLTTLIITQPQPMTWSNKYKIYKSQSSELAWARNCSVIDMLTFRMPSEKCYSNMSIFAWINGYTSKDKIQPIIYLHQPYNMLNIATVSLSPV